MKRLVVCCDGTWQQLASPCPSNIVKLSQSVKPVADLDGTAQIVFYDPGIGTEYFALLGGAMGLGIEQNIQDCYRFLCLNYDDGDEIYLFGFSRGAYTVRSLAGMIHCSGLLRRKHITQAPNAYELYRDRSVKPGDQKAADYRKKFGKDEGKPVPITLLGCFDTVGALGIPLIPPFNLLAPLLHSQYQFHDTTLNRYIENALHAIAIDEIREVFDVTPMRPSPDNNQQRVIEKWFPGDHGCVGGGTNELRPLSDAALEWMIDSIKDLGLGLEFNKDYVLHDIETDYKCKFNNAPGFYALAGIKYRHVGDVVDGLHDTTISRLKASKDYRPKNLKKIISQLNLK